MYPEGFEGRRAESHEATSTSPYKLFATILVLYLWGSKAGRCFIPKPQLHDGRKGGEPSFKGVSPTLRVLGHAKT